MRFIFLSMAVLFVLTGVSMGAGPKISENGNKHNFSSSNTAVNFRAIATGDNPTYPRSDQVCVFCHTPHRSSGEGPLWNRQATVKTFFKHYSSTGMAIDDPSMRSATGYGQPTGSSRLCLSCHDGVTALGAVFASPMGMTPANIQFTDSKGQTGADVTLGYETYSSHHPVSFKYDGPVIASLRAMGKLVHYTQPATNEVKLDKEFRMQCTTCHDPHQDKSNSPDISHPFWTSGEYDAVCTSCHDGSSPFDPWKP